MSRLCAVSLLILPISLCGCATIYNPATEQKEFIFVTTATEVSLGKAVAGKIAQEYKISQDTELINKVKEAGDKISQVSDRKDLTYQFFVIEDKTLNAFTTPGGYIYINSGVIEKATPDELACVIGHETGHIAARHIAKKLQAQIGYDLLMNIAASKTNIKDLQRAASISYDLVMLGYSREDELLADRLGAKYASKAGYDPYSMVSFLKKLKEINKEELGFIFLRSHPYISQRIQLLEKQIPAIIEKLDRTKEQNKSVLSKEERINLEKDTKNRPLKVMCPVCKRIFPGTTNFCPYDGTKLQ